MIELYSVSKRKADVQLYILYKCIIVYMRATLIDCLWIFVVSVRVTSESGTHIIMFEFGKKP